MDWLTGSGVMTGWGSGPAQGGLRQPTRRQRTGRRATRPRRPNGSRTAPRRPRAATAVAAPRWRGRGEGPRPWSPPTATTYSGDHRPGSLSRIRRQPPRRTGTSSGTRVSPPGRCGAQPAVGLALQPFPHTDPLLRTELLLRAGPRLTAGPPTPLRNSRSRPPPCPRRRVPGRRRGRSVRRRLPPRRGAGRAAVRPRR